MKRLSFHPKAKIEMVESARFYEAEQVELGKHFLESVHVATQKIRLFPSIFQCVEGNVRRCRVERFPFGVVFREERDEIQIIAVVHFKRDPGYWKNRLCPEMHHRADDSAHTEH